MLAGNPPSPTGKMTGREGSAEPPAEEEDEGGVSLDDDWLGPEEDPALPLPELWGGPLAPDAEDCGGLAPWKEDQSCRDHDRDIIHLIGYFIDQQGL